MPKKKKKVVLSVFYVASFTSFTPTQSETMACCTKQPDMASRCANPAETNKDAMVRESVKEYYGQRLQNKDDCQTGVNCLVDSSMPRHVRQALSQVHDDVTIK